MFCCIIINLVFLSVTEDEGGKGAIKVAEALEKNKGLVQFNYLTLPSGNEGALAIAKALTANTTLTDLTYLSLYLIRIARKARKLTVQSLFSLNSGH